MKPIQPASEPHIAQSVICLSGIVALVLGSLFFVHTSLQSIIAICIVWVMGHAYYANRHPSYLIRYFLISIRQSTAILSFFLLIGGVIASFTVSGAIPTLIDFGLHFISTQAFLPIGMILCSIMSLAIGSCWGTIGTMGVALMGVAGILHIPLPLAAGMIVSGAYFGDKFSPISDTTILSALSTGTNLYQHIKGMTYSMIPAYILTLGLFWWIGQDYSLEEQGFTHELTQIQQLIHAHFQINGFTLMPIVVMLTLSLCKIPATITMFSSIITALIVAITIQHLTILDAFNALLIGPSIVSTGSTVLDAALNHGGIQGMLWPMLSALMILTMGRLLEHYQFINVLFARLIQQIKRPVTLIFSTMSTAVLCNILMGEAYLSIILTSRIFKNAYHALGLESCALSKSIEEAATFSTPLIPWTTSGMFISVTLGINAGDYLHWNLFNWIAPAFFLIFVASNFAGVKMFMQQQTVSRLTKNTIK